MSSKVIDLIRASEQESPKGVVTFLNPFSYSLLRRDSNLVGFDVIYIDGISMVWVLALFGIRVTRRSFDMTSIAHEVFYSCKTTPRTVAVVGSTAENAAAFSKAIATEFPGVDMVYVRSGYFQDEAEWRQSIDQLCSLNPDMVVCGMGAGKQEKFLSHLKGHGWKGIGFTCGGFIHQTASKGVKYYPDLVNRFHVRWLYRIFDEPKLLKRYAISYPIAIVVLSLDLLRFKCSSANFSRQN